MTTKTTQNNDVGDDQQEKEEIPTKEVVDHNEDDNNDNDDNQAATKSRKRLQRFVQILLVLPYTVGILWTCLHPIVSVITGEMKCRGWYLDEHSIETRFTDSQSPQGVPSHLKNLQMSPRRQKKQNGNGNDMPSSMCDFFAKDGDPDFNANNLICHTHGDHFEVAMVMPLSNAIDATEEAIVLVVPSPEQVYPLSEGEEDGTRDWGSSRLHQAMVQSIKHLADPVGTPWLAKAVLVVTPTMTKTTTSSSGDSDSDRKSLDETVSSFLDAYLGQQTTPRDYQIKRQRIQQQEQQDETVPLLPPRLSGAILRNLVVLQVLDGSAPRTSKSTSLTAKTDLAILPQGRRGVLPNADLVFLVGRLMEQTMFFKHASATTFLAHPYTQESKDAAVWIDQTIAGLDLADKKMAKKAKTWANGMVDVSLFARTLAVGPVPPHAAALERGIDSLTVRASFTGTFHRDPAVEFVQYSEYIVRSLANLHERLHHSFTLYLLPTPKTFVSHIEYLLPNILLLLPLAVRVFGMILPTMKGGLDLTAVGGVLLILLIVAIVMLLTTTVLSSSNDDSQQQTMTAMLLVMYVGVAIFWIQKILWRKRKPIEKSSGIKDKEDIEDDSSDTTRTIQTLQFVSCALAVYILVPIAFAHASLAYLPSMLWSPLLAFPDYAAMKKGGIASRVNKFVVIPILSLLALVTAHPLFMVPVVFSTYTTFVQFVYVPLHVLFFLLVTSIIVS